MCTFAIVSLQEFFKIKSEISPRGQFVHSSFYPCKIEKLCVPNKLLQKFIHWFIFVHGFLKGILSYVLSNL